ncbi:MAG TPA: ABC transporter ATP-binding protein [Acidimicrobiales bacterium]
MTGDDFVIEADAVTKRFRRRTALRECSLSVPRGRVAALVGPNGSGKTTLLRLLAGLSRPTTGTISVFGEEMSMSNTELRSRVGYLDQDRPLYPGWRVREILEFGRRINPAWDRELATRHLALLDIDVKSRIRNLSGGQRAQVALAVCFAKRPELVLLDEPASALDPVARQDLLQNITELFADHDASVLMATHAIADVAAICDYVVILSNSRVVLSEDLEYVLESHRLLSRGVDDGVSVPRGAAVLEERRSTREVTYLVRLAEPLERDGWRIERPTLDEIAVAYLREGQRTTSLSAHATPGEGPS